MHQSQIVSNTTLCDSLRVYKNGECIGTIDDLMTTNGLAWVASRIAGVANAATHLAVGAGSTPAAPGDVALESELARVPLEVSGGTVSGNMVTFQATFPAGVGTGTIQEIGLMTAAVDGVLICRNVKGPFAKGANDELGFDLVIRVQ